MKQLIFSLASLLLACARLAAVAAIVAVFMLAALVACVVTFAGASAYAVWRIIAALFGAGK